jgi:hypothetical protein
MITGWKDLFQTHILERGIGFHVSGAVVSLKCTDDGFEATVLGSDDYIVEIIVEDNRVYDMNCDCPYALNGSYCKHMVAVLCKIDENNQEATFEFDLYEGFRYNEKEVAETIKKIPVEELRDLVAGVARENEAFRNQILVEYSEFFNEKQMVRLKEEVDNIAHQHSDRYGYVSYSAGSGYYNSLCAFLDKNAQSLIDKGYYLPAFELVNYVFNTVGNQDMDDSGGESGYVGESCYDYWKLILCQCDEDEKKKMRQWFIDNKEGYVIDYMEEYIEEFLANEFRDEGILLEQLRIVDDVIRRGDGADCGNWYSVYYGSENALVRRLRIMEKLGHLPFEIEEYKKKYRSYPIIREIEISEHLENKDYAKALKVIDESKQIDKESSDLIKKYSEQLIDIYSELDDKKRYKEELLFQIFECTQYNLSYIKKLKETSDDTEWTGFHKRIMEAKSCSPIRLSFMELEQLYEQLLVAVISKGDLWVLDQYESVLKKIYPGETRMIYEKFVRKRAEEVSSRNGYAGLTRYLDKISTYPNGRAKAQEIADNWRIEYRRRPAMIDELGKAGY